MSTKLLIPALAILGLAACKQVGHPEPHFGEAVNRNIAVQIVNPDAPADKGPIAHNAERMGLAQERYVKGKVIKPSDFSTSTVILGGSGGGGEGGSK